jgi:hypothetical protein
MDQLERLIKMAEDELTEYSTDARKMEKLRRKIGLSVPAAEQRRCRETLAAQMSSGGLAKLVEEQRQTVALPFWGIAGLGLLGSNISGAIRGLSRGGCRNRCRVPYSKMGLGITGQASPAANPRGY